VRSWWREVKKERYESRPTRIAAMETLPRSMYMTTICSRTVSKGSAPPMIIPAIAPGRKMIPVVFVLSIRGSWRS